MAKKITDQEMRKAMGLAGIPVQFQNRDTLLAKAPKGADIDEWLNLEGRAALRRGGSVVEFVSEKPEGEDLYWLTARYLIVSQVSVICYHAQELVPPLAEETLWDSFDNVRVIAVEGLATGIEGQFSPAQRSTLEWLLSSRLNAGYSLLMLNDRALSHATEYSNRFRQSVNRRTLKRFAV